MRRLSLLLLRELHLLVLDVGGRIEARPAAAERSWRRRSRAGSTSSAASSSATSCRPRWTRRATTTASHRCAECRMCRRWGARSRGRSRRGSRRWPRRGSGQRPAGAGASSSSSVAPGTDRGRWTTMRTTAADAVFGAATARTEPCTGPCTAHSSRPMRLLQLPLLRLVHLLELLCEESTFVSE